MTLKKQKEVAVKYLQEIHNYTEIEAVNEVEIEFKQKTISVFENLKDLLKHIHLSDLVIDRDLLSTKIQNSHINETLGEILLKSHSKVFKIDGYYIFDPYA